VTVCEKYLDSDVFTSRRFEVSDQDSTATESESSEEEERVNQVSDRFQLKP